MHEHVRCVVTSRSENPTHPQQSIHSTIALYVALTCLKLVQLQPSHDHQTPGQNAPMKNSYQFNLKQKMFFKNSGKKSQKKLEFYECWTIQGCQATSCKAVTSLNRCLNWLQRCSSAATALAVSTTLQRPLALQGDPAASNSRTSTAFRNKHMGRESLGIFNAACYYDKV